MKLLTTKEVAFRLGISIKRVQELIKGGRLPAQKPARDYFVKESDLRLVQDRKPGRPKKTAKVLQSEKKVSKKDNKK